MKDDDFWDLCFLSVVSMRFHPRNTEYIDNVQVEHEVKLAAIVADEAAMVRSERCLGDKRPVRS